jgi:hypothetical protein
MKFTLLEGVQEILSALDSDEVNSITDTVESHQVALIFKSVYYDLFNELNLGEHEITFGLVPSADPTKPVLATLPETVTKVSWIKYDCRETGDTTPDYNVITFMPFDDFVSMQEGLRDDTEMDSMVVDGLNNTFTLLYKTDKHPEWYTFYDNNVVLFDSLDIDIDSTLQQSKFLCLGHAYPDFDLDDSFVPDLDPSQFRHYIHKSKERAFAELKQIENKNASLEARRQKIVTQKRKNRIATRPAIFDTPRYGRK